MSILLCLGKMMLTMLRLLPVWAVARWGCLRLTGRDAAWRTEILLALFALYLAAVAGQTILPRISWIDGALTVCRWSGGGQKPGH